MEAGSNSVKSPLSNLYTRRRKAPREAAPSRRYEGHILEGTKKLRIVCSRKVEGGVTHKVPFLERSRKYWGREILMPNDVERIDVKLKEGMCCGQTTSAKFWTTTSILYCSVMNCPTGQSPHGCACCRGNFQC